jgi:hypothetical protein
MKMVEKPRVHNPMVPGAVLPGGVNDLGTQSTSMKLQERKTREEFG